MGGVAGRSRRGTVMNVFVAGGTGAIGVPLVRALVAAGHSVTALTRHQSRTRAASGARGDTGRGRCARSQRVDSGSRNGVPDARRSPVDGAAEGRPAGGLATSNRRTACASTARGICWTRRSTQARGGSSSGRLRPYLMLMTAIPPSTRSARWRRRCWTHRRAGPSRA